jgi:hypothetical protein
MLSLLVREIGLTARTFGPPYILSHPRILIPFAIVWRNAAFTSMSICFWNHNKDCRSMPKSSRNTSRMSSFSISTNFTQIKNLLIKRRYCWSIIVRITQPNRPWIFPVNRMCASFFCSPHNSHLPSPWCDAIWRLQKTKIIAFAAQWWYGFFKFLITIYSDFKQNIVEVNVWNAFQALGFEIDIAQQSYNLLAADEKLKESSELKELRSFDFLLDNLSRYWREIKFKWINKPE